MARNMQALKDAAECSKASKRKKDAAAKRQKRDEGRTREFRSRRTPNPIVNGMRVCRDCGENRPIEQFTVKTDRKCKEGKTVLGVCKSCERKARIARRTPEKRIQERARIARRKGKSYTPGPRGRSFDQMQSVAAKQNAKESWQWWLVNAPGQWVEQYWAAIGRPWGNPRLSGAERYRLRYSMDVDFNLSERLRRQHRKKAKRDGIAEIMRGALRRGGDSPSVQERCGYSIAELKAHLERQFTKGMSWPRFMAGEIHIDHIIPQKEFDLRDDEQWRKCWCLSNLRPLWARDNLAKRDKRLFLL
jgi:hypothetical protein